MEVKQPLRNRCAAILIWVMPLLLGAALRFQGLNWDGLQFLHPDERFLVQVAEKASLPASLSANGLIQLLLR